MTVDKYWLDQLIMALANNDVGVVGGKIYNYRSDIIQTTGGKIDWNLGRSTMIGCGERDRGQYDSLREVDYVDVPTVKRDVMNRIGEIDEDYDMYCTDVDYCIRAKKAGYGVLYVPGAVSWHRSSATIGASSMKKYSLSQKDSLRLLLKHSSPPLMLYRVYLRILVALITISFGLLRGRTHTIRPQVTAIIWNLARLPNTIRSRGKLWL